MNVKLALEHYKGIHVILQTNKFHRYSSILFELLFPHAVVYSDYVSKQLPPWELIPVHAVSFLSSGTVRCCGSANSGGRFGRYTRQFGLTRNASNRFTASRSRKITALLN